MIHCDIICAVRVDIIECNLVFAFCEVINLILERLCCHCSEAVCCIVYNDFVFFDAVEVVNYLVFNCCFGSALEYDIVALEEDFFCISLCAVVIKLAERSESCGEFGRIVNLTCVCCRCVCILRIVACGLDCACKRIIFMTEGYLLNEVRVCFNLCAVICKESNGNKLAVFSCRIENCVLLNIVAEVEMINYCKISVCLETESYANLLFEVCACSCDCFTCAEDCKSNILCCVNEDVVGSHCDFGNSYKVAGCANGFEVLSEIFVLLCESEILAVNSEEVEDCSNEVCSLTVCELVIGVDCINLGHKRCVERSAILVCSVHPVVLPMIAVLRNVVLIAHKSCDNNACFCECYCGFGSVIAVAVACNEVTLVAIADSRSVSLICFSLVLEYNNVSENVLFPPFIVYPSAVDLRDPKREFGSCYFRFCRACEVSNAVLFEFLDCLVIPLCACGRNACKCTDNHYESEYKSKDSCDVFHSIPPIFFRCHKG